MSLTPERHAELKRYAIQLRRLVVESVHHAGAGHLGGLAEGQDEHWPLTGRWPLTGQFEQANQFQLIATVQLIRRAQFMNESSANIF